MQKADTLQELKKIWELRAKREAAEKAFTLALSDAKYVYELHGTYEWFRYNLVILIKSTRIYNLKPRGNASERTHTRTSSDWMHEYSKSIGSLDARIIKSAAVDAESSEPGLILGVTRLKQHLRDGNNALEKARDEMHRIEPLLTELVASARPRITRSTQMPIFANAIPITYGLFISSHIRIIITYEYSSRIRTSCIVFELSLSLSLSLSLKRKSLQKLIELGNNFLANQ